MASTQRPVSSSKILQVLMKPVKGAIKYIFTSADEFEAMSSPDSLTKKYITQIVAAILMAEKALKQLQQQYLRLQQQRSEFYKRYDESESYWNNNSPVDSKLVASLIANRESILNEINNVETQFTQVSNEIERLQDQLQFLKTEATDMDKYIQPWKDIQKEQTQEVQQGLQQILDQIPTLDLRPKQRKQVLKDFADENNNRATLIEAEAQYLKSMKAFEAQHPGGMAADQAPALEKQRNVHTIALRNTVQNELRLQFFLQKLLKKQHPNRNMADIRKEANQLVSALFKEDVIQQFVNRLENQYEYKDVETLSEKKSFGVIQTEIEGVKKDIQINQQTLVALMHQYKDLTQQLKGNDAQLQAQVSSKQYATPLPTRPVPVLTRTPQDEE